MKMKEIFLEKIRKRFDRVKNDNLYILATILVTTRYKTKLLTRIIEIGTIVTSLREKYEEIKN